MNGPERYLAYHQAIRTQFGSDRPAYEWSYRSKALQRAKALKPKDFRRNAPLPWIERGPGNVGGRARGLWLDPSDTTAQTLLVGSAGGGIWKTEDAGKNWRIVTPDFPTLSTATIAGGVSNPLVVYAGTGEGFGASNNTLGDGLWKSIDGGESWVQLESTAGGTQIAVIYRIVVNPLNENEFLFASLTHPRLPRGNEISSNVYRSTDGGQTINSTFESDRAIQQIIADPNDFNVLYATINGSGIIRSRDAGQNWDQIFETQEFDRMEMAISSTDASHLYLSGQGNDVAEDANNSHIMHSPNGGRDWFDVEPIDAANQFGDWFSGQGWYDNAIAVHPFDSSIIYVGGAGPLLKIDIEEFDTANARYLATMEPVADGYGEYRDRFPSARSKGVHVDHHNILLVPRNKVDGSFLFISANDGGVAFSKDGGASFLQTGDTFKEECDDPFCNTTIEYETATGFNTSQFYGVDKQNGSDRFVAGTQDNGSWVSPSDPSASTAWNAAPGGDGFEAIWHYHKTNQLVESSQFNSVFRSDNRGVSWRALELPGDGPFLTRLAGSQQDPDLIYAVSNLGVLKSFDFGDHWQVIEMPGTWRFEGLGTPIRIALANPNIVWTGSGLRENADMAVSTDGGTNFNVISRYEQATLGIATNIATHPLHDSTAYFLFSQADGPKIIRTTNLGKNLEDITGFVSNRDKSLNGYPDVATYSLVVMPYDDQVLWAGTEIGLFESTDAGGTWHLADNGLPNVAIYDMKIVNEQVVLATHGRGIWTVALPELEGYEPPAVVALAPQILLESADFGPRVTGTVALRSAADSSYLTYSYTLDSQLITQEVKLDPNSTPTNVDFSEIVLGLAGDEFVELTVTISSFFGASVLRSEASTLVHAVEDDPISQYFTDFDDGLRNFARLKWEIEQPTGFSGLSLNSPHPYFGNDEYIAVFQIPVLIASTTTPVTFDEIVLVEPGDTDEFPSRDFFDFCLVEGTADFGQTWVTMAAYDSRDDEAWLRQYDLDENNATPELVTSRTIELNDFFSEGDTVYLRFKLVSDPFVEGWGWKIDNFQVGSDATPTVNIDDANLAYTLLANPVKNLLQVHWSTNENIAVDLHLVSLSGQILMTSKQISIADGLITTWDVSDYPAGIYVIQVNQGSQTGALRWLKL